MSKNRNRDKGHNAERYYVLQFKNLGFSFCKTSRFASKLIDDCGIDMVGLPFNVQVKAGYAKGLNYFKTLSLINGRLKINFPPEDVIHNKINIIIHKLDTGRGKKRTEFDELVILEKDSLKNICPAIHEDMCIIKIGQKRSWTFKELLKKIDFVIHRQKNEKELIVMSFKKFKEIIKNIKWQ